MQYPDYHAQCQEMFPGNEPKINLTDFGFVVIPPTSNDNEDILKLPSNYLKLIDSLASKVNKQLENPEENCYWLKNTPQNLRDLAHYIKNPFGLSETHDIANSILPQLEKSIFGSYVHVMLAVIKRHNVVQQTEKVSSWIWHYDNNPNEVIKIMIYLNDVDENGAPLEYLVDANDKPVKVQPSRNGPDDWFTKPTWADSRVPDSVLNKYLEKGCKQKKITGPKGTIIIFNQNVLHRANIATSNHRNTLLYQLKPSKTKLNPYVNSKWTGSYQHRASLVDPTWVKAIKKESVKVTLGKLRSKYFKRN
jgi:hypothetical protein